MRPWLNSESYQGCGIEQFRRSASFFAIRRLVLATLLAGLFVSAANGQVNILTNRYDNLRTASNLNETVLNASNVNPSQFGKLYSYPVDGAVFAQPLYVQGLTINGAVHNVLFVATMNDKVYAFDADSNSPPLWSRDFTNGTSITPVPLTDINVNPFIVGNMGIESTPVIDLTTKTIYLLVRTK